MPGKRKSYAELRTLASDIAARFRRRSSSTARHYRFDALPYQCFQKCCIFSQYSSNCRFYRTYVFFYHRSVIKHAYEVMMTGKVTSRRATDIITINANMEPRVTGHLQKKKKVSCSVVIVLQNADASMSPSKFRRMSCPTVRLRRAVVVNRPTSPYTSWRCGFSRRGFVVFRCRGPPQCLR